MRSPICAPSWIWPITGALRSACAYGLLICCGIRVKTWPHTKALLEDPAKTQTYIDNALTPILEEIGAHPAILTWKFSTNQRDMTEEFGFTEVRTPMAAVQQFINLTAGAIHSTVPGAMVSSGAGNFATMTDIEGHTNYYPG